MTPEEVRVATRQLNELLLSRGLEWVVEEVSSVIEEGVEVNRSVAFEQFSIYGEASPKKGPRSEVTSTRPYTDEEQLELLVVAVKNVLVDGSAMRREIFLELGKDAAVRVIEFEPDVPSDLQEKGFIRLPEKQGRPFRLTPEDAEIAIKMNRLSEISNFVVKELHANK